MKREQIDLYRKLDTEIKHQCLEISKELHTIWPSKYQVVTNDIYDINDLYFEDENHIYVSDEIYEFGDTTYLTSIIQVDWLTMDIEDIKNTVLQDKLEAERKLDEVSKQCKLNEQQRREKEEYTKYLELKKKFENS